MALGLVGRGKESGWRTSCLPGPRSFCTRRTVRLGGKKVMALRLKRGAQLASLQTLDMSLSTAVSAKGGRSAEIKCGAWVGASSKVSLETMDIYKSGDVAKGEFHSSQSTSTRTSLINSAGHQGYCIRFAITPATRTALTTDANHASDFAEEPRFDRCRRVP